MIGTCLTCFNILQQSSAIECSVIECSAIDHSDTLPTELFEIFLKNNPSSCAAKLRVSEDLAIPSQSWGILDAFLLCLKLKRT